MNQIIGRNKEISILNSLYTSKSAKLAAFYGRRRIGKTYLITNYFADKGVLFEITGTKKATLKTQLANFHREYTALFHAVHYATPPGNWDEAFERIASGIELIQNKQKIIIFIDELPWLATPRSGFIPALEYAWNRHLSRKKNVLMIVCGSAASWMINNVVKNKEGLFGRLDSIVPMYPFDLHITEEYLLSQHVKLPYKQIAEIYMALGGIGKYLSHIKPGKSAAQIINDLYFTPHSPLFLEFKDLFNSLFEQAERHIRIVEALSKKRYGMLQKELLSAANLPQSGTSSTILYELEVSGFIMSIPMFDKKKQERKFRLTDEFSLFFLKWVDAQHTNILRNANPDYWKSIYHSPSWLSWAGYAFENLCLKHISKIKAALGISGINTNEYHWFIDGNHHDHGAEIDLIIDRQDNCINLCEIKFSNQAFTITKQYAETLINKRERFREYTKTKKAIFITFITPFGVSKNQYCQELVQNEVILDDFFRA